MLVGLFPDIKITKHHTSICDVSSWQKQSYRLVTKTWIEFHCKQKKALYEAFDDIDDLFTIINFKRLNHVEFSNVIYCPYPPPQIAVCFYFRKRSVRSKNLCLVFADIRGTSSLKSKSVVFVMMSVIVSTVQTREPDFNQIWNMGIFCPYVWILFHFSLTKHLGLAAIKNITPSLQNNGNILGNEKIIFEFCLFYSFRVKRSTWIVCHVTFFCLNF